MHEKPSTTSSDSTPRQSHARRERASNTTPVEQATLLRDSLRDAASAANQLVRSLKQNKRQARLVQSTLESLKQLQKVAG